MRSLEGPKVPFCRDMRAAVGFTARGGGERMQLKPGFSVEEDHVSSAPHRCKGE